MTSLERRIECTKASILMYTLRVHYNMSNAHFEDNIPEAKESMRKAKVFVDLAEEATDDLKRMIHSI